MEGSKPLASTKGFGWGCEHDEEPAERSALEGPFISPFGVNAGICDAGRVHERASLNKIRVAKVLLVRGIQRPSVEAQGREDTSDGPAMGVQVGIWPEAHDLTASLSRLPPSGTLAVDFILAPAALHP